MYNFVYIIVQSIDVAVLRFFLQKKHERESKVFFLLFNSFALLPYTHTHPHTNNVCVCVGTGTYGGHTEGYF